MNPHAVLQWWQVWVIGGALWLGLLPALGTYHLGTPELQSAAAVAAVFVPIAVAPLWWTVRRDPRTAGSDGVASAVEGASAAIAHYNAAAGVGVDETTASFGVDAGAGVAVPASRNSFSAVKNASTIFPVV